MFLIDITTISKGFIGTYTKGNSKGIYKFSFNNINCEIDSIDLAAEIGNPTFLSISKDKKFLYSVIKTTNEGGVASYLINEDLSLSLLNYKISPGASPCHLITDSKNSFLFSANYHTGEISCYSLLADGSIGNLESRVYHTGSGINNERQEKPHPHFVCLTPNEEKLLAIDLGVDKLFVYDYENGLLKEDTSRSVKLPDGVGPRHMAFHENNKVAFLISELTSEVFVLSYNIENNTFNIFQKISAIPENFKGQTDAAAIHISPDGRFLYTSNRGFDSIAVFSIDKKTFKLNLVEITETKGSHPRDFSIDPSGKFLIVPHQLTPNITLFHRDIKTGKLTKADKEFVIESGVCIKFI
ncbi:beta-propeller fold lactonase family protein [Clostridium tertium]|uniref:6-phosphogluconolactonase n=1 Tax=Clostridium tertium TaxID=1559 RepID=A0A6N3ELD9_9CLOT